MNKLLICLFLLITVACQKDDPDLRDQFIGAYDVTFITVGKSDKGEYSASGEDVVTVRKGSDRDELLFNEFGQEHPVILDGKTFDVPTFKLRVDLDFYEISGSGFFNGSRLQYTLNAKALDFFDESTITVQGVKR